jgi:cation diffusion facilitator CzcD-associated flavoprotein CzcO
MTASKTLVIGGGIGGPVAAMALQRAGIQAIVYEATEAPADYAGLFLNPPPTAWTCCAPSTSTSPGGQTASRCRGW